MQRHRTCGVVLGSVLRSMGRSQRLYVLVCVVVAASSARSAVAHTAASNPFLPRWTAPMPDASKPLAGYAYVANRSLTEVYHAVPEVSCRAVACVPR